MPKVGNKHYAYNELGKKAAAKAKRDIVNFPSNVKKGIDKVKESYGYFKAGRKAEFDAENARLKASNIKRLKENEVVNFHETKGKSFWKKATGGRMK